MRKELSSSSNLPLGEKGRGSSRYLAHGSLRDERNEPIRLRWREMGAVYEREMYPHKITFMDSCDIDRLIEIER